LSRDPSRNGYPIARPYTLAKRGRVNRARRPLLQNRYAQCAISCGRVIWRFTHDLHASVKGSEGWGCVDRGSDLRLWIGYFVARGARVRPAGTATGTTEGPTFEQGGPIYRILSARIAHCETTPLDVFYAAVDQASTGEVVHGSLSSRSRPLKGRRVRAGRTRMAQDRLGR